MQQRDTGPLFDAARALESTYWNAWRRHDAIAANAWNRYGSVLYRARLRGRPVNARTEAHWEAHVAADARRRARLATMYAAFEAAWTVAVRDRYGCEPGQVKR